MVVDHRERMAPQARCDLHAALEVHLPQQVRRRLLEALVAVARLRGLRDPVVTLQNAVNRRDRRRRDPVALETAGDLARTPGRIGVANPKNRVLKRGRRPLGAPPRAARAIIEVFHARPAPPQPLVPGLAADLEAAAQRAHIRPFHRGKHHELPSLIHDRHLSPRHGDLHKFKPTTPVKVSTMSPNRCQGCLRAIHSSVGSMRTGSSIFSLLARTAVKRVPVRCSGLQATAIDALC